MKKFILSLFIWFVWIISFCSAAVIDRTNCAHAAWVVCSNDDFVFLRYWDSSSSMFSWAIINVYSGYAMKTNYPRYFKCYDNSGVLFYDWTNIWNGWQPLLYFKVDWYCVWFSSMSDDSTKVNFYDFHSLFDWASSSQYTSEECQSEYDLVPSSNLISCQSSLSGCQSSLNTCQSDLNICQSNTSWFNDLLNSCSNNLNACNTSLSSCLSNNCPVSSWWINWSSLFINWLQHNSAPYISVSIPEEIAWDYTSTEDEFDLAVSWYNVDTDYIAWIIVNQNSKPSQEDLNKLISEVLPLFIPWLAIILFIYFVFRFIKKIF